jgi:hypothetical protein
MDVPNCSLAFYPWILLPCVLISFLSSRLLALA